MRSTHDAAHSAARRLSTVRSIARDFRVPSPTCERHRRTARHAAQQRSLTSGQIADLHGPSTISGGQAGPVAGIQLVFGEVLPCDVAGRLVLRGRSSPVYNVGLHQHGFTFPSEPGVLFPGVTPGSRLLLGRSPAGSERRIKQKGAQPGRPLSLQDFFALPNINASRSLRPRRPGLSSTTLSG